MSIDERRVTLSNLPRFELMRKQSMRLTIARHHHESARISIESMDDARSSDSCRNPNSNAVGFFWTDSRDGKNAAFLVNDHKECIEMYDAKPQSPREFSS